MVRKRRFVAVAGARWHQECTITVAHRLLNQVDTQATISYSQPGAGGNQEVTIDIDDGFQGRFDDANSVQDRDPA